MIGSSSSYLVIHPYNKANFTAAFACFENCVTYDKSAPVPGSVQTSCCNVRCPVTALSSPVGPALVAPLAPVSAPAPSLAPVVALPAPTPAPAALAPVVPVKSLLNNAILVELCAIHNAITMNNHLTANLRLTVESLNNNMVHYGSCMLSAVAPVTHIFNACDHANISGSSLTTLSCPQIPSHLSESDLAEYSTHHHDFGCKRKPSSSQSKRYPNHLAATRTQHTIHL